MKVIKITLGVLAGMFALAQVVNLIMILTHSTGNVYQISRIGGAAAGLLIGAAISLSLFKSVLKKQTESTET